MDMFKSQRHTRLGPGRRVSQANEAAIHSKLPGLCQHEIVSIVMKAMWGCASQLWVPGRSCVHGHPYLSFCLITHNSATNRFQVMMSLHKYYILYILMILHIICIVCIYGCRIKKGADLYPFCPGGSTKRRVWGLGGPPPPPPKHPPAPCLNFSFQHGGLRGCVAAVYQAAIKYEARHMK